jgi:CSLREA domain-containing protein
MEGINVRQRTWKLRSFALAAVLAGVVVVLAAGAGVAHADPLTFVVTTTGDDGDGVCDATCEIREAIDAANRNPGHDTITFRIGDGQQTIFLNFELPAISESVTIDGTTQPGFSGRPLIYLEGSSTSNANGLRITAGGSTVKGLIVGNFDNAGIRLVSGGNNTIIGNWIGLDAGGFGAARNGDGVIVMQSSGNRIGSLKDGERNLISGNDGDGIVLRPIDGPSNDNLIEGNWIGLDRGNAPLGNLGAGIRIEQASNNVITRNQIANNIGDAVQVEAGVSNAVTGNSIHDNDKLGIDLYPDGVTENDPNDEDTGPNNLQNFPDLTGASFPPGQVKVDGVLTGVQLFQRYRVELFANSACDESGNGEADQLVGSTIIDEGDNGGTIGWSITFDEPEGNLRWITATATRLFDGGAETSEISKCLDLAADITSFVVNTVDDTDDGVCTRVHCTLREAINAANADPGAETIGFSIGAGPQTIYFNSPMTALTGPVTIDGSTQPGWDGPPVIELTPEGGLENGLVVRGGSTTVRELAIGGFSGSALMFMGAVGGNTADGNWIGLDLTGAENRNGGSGVWTSVPATTVVDNVLSGNDTAGLTLHGPITMDVGANDSAVRGNRIGTDPSGTAAIPNGTGIVVASAGNAIGDGYRGVGNLISGNSGDGVVMVGAADSILESNGIGVDIQGAALPNGGDGVRIESGLGNTVRDNTIRANGGDGVAVIGDSAGNAIRGNAVDANGGLGIDLGPNGVTDNDRRDADTGANGLQNFPIITAVRTDDGTFATGALLAAPTSDYLLEFFASRECDPSGNGEGARPIGTLSVKTGGTGRADFFRSFDFSVIGPGDLITATATDMNGNTSEFSPCVLYGTSAPGALVELVAASATVPAGAGSVPLENVPFDQIAVNFGDDLAAAPLRGIPLRGIPLRGIDLNASPLRGIPLRGIGLDAAGLQGALGTLLLSSLPLDTTRVPGGWDTVLAEDVNGNPTELAGRPLQTVTLAQVFALDPPARRIEGQGAPALTIGDIDTENSPLRSLSVVSLALGNTPLEKIAVGDGTNDAERLEDWCALLAGPPVNCSGGGGGLQSTSLVGLELAGVPLRGIPLRGIPLRGIDLAESPLRGIAMQDTNLAMSPLRGIPLRGIALASAPLRGIPLRGIVLAESPLRGIRCAASSSRPRRSAASRCGGSRCGGSTRARRRSAGSR